MSQSITINAPRHRFSIVDYHRLGEVGILGEDDRVELIYGEIIQMSPIGPKHSGSLDRIAQFLTLLFRDAPFGLNQWTSHLAFQSCLLPPIHNKHTSCD